MKPSTRARRGAAYFSIFLIFGVLPSAAHAAAILVSEQRAVRSFGDVGSLTSFQAWTVEERSPGSFGSFDFTVDESRQTGTNSSSASASQSSNISTTSIIASGTTNSVVSINEPSNFSGADADSSSRFEVTFQVLSPTTFDLSGSLSFQQTDGSPRGSAFVSLFDGTSSGNLFSLNLGQSFAFNSFTQNIQLSGILDPATYTLRATASVDADGFSSIAQESGTAAFDIAFLLGANGISPSPVPVPAAAWLFGSALGLLGWARRRVS